MRASTIGVSILPSTSPLASDNAILYNNEGVSSEGLGSEGSNNDAVNYAILYNSESLLTLLCLTAAPVIQ